MHTENRWQEQFVIGGKIHGLLRTHKDVKKCVQTNQMSEAFFLFKLSNLPNAVWNHFQNSFAKTQFAKIGGYQSRLLEIYTLPHGTPVARFTVGAQ